MCNEILERSEKVGRESRVSEERKKSGEKVELESEVRNQSQKMEKHWSNNYEERKQQNEVTILAVENDSPSFWWNHDSRQMVIPVIDVVSNN